MPNLTARQAQAAYRKVCKHYGITPDPQIREQGDGTNWGLDAKPHLVRHFDRQGRWAVVWEEGPFDWTVLLPWDAVGATVFSEPINGYALGLYPAA